MASQPHTGPPERRSMLFVRFMGTVWVAWLSPCRHSATGKAAKVNRDRRSHRHSWKSSAVWLLGVVPPRSQQTLTGSLVAPAAQEPWRRQHLETALFNRFTRGRKEICLSKATGPVSPQHEQQQILASLPPIPKERIHLEEASQRPGGISPASQEVVLHDSEERRCLETDDPGLNHSTAVISCLSLRNSTDILSLSLLIYVNWSETVPFPLECCGRV